MDIDYKRLKVAIVTDWMYRPGGSDRLVHQLIKIFPLSTVFTAYFKRAAYEDFLSHDYQVIPSWMQKLPFVGSLYRHYNVLSPLAFESFDFIGYDLVISLSAGAAKGVITRVNQPHVAIILTPPRGLWDKELNTKSTKLNRIYKLLSSLTAHYLRIWDIAAIERSDLQLAISHYIALKTNRIYKRNVDILYPGVDKWWFAPSVGLEGINVKDPYFLVVSRLYDYKMVDIAIRACIEKGQKLLIVGEGPARPSLEKWCSDLVRVQFLGNTPDIKLKQLYKNAQALIFPGVEDFGYVQVEAMAQGTPVIAYNEGGSTETVVPEITGELYNTYEELCNTLENFDKLKYNEAEIIKNASRFSEENFQKSFETILDDFFTKSENSHLRPEL